MLRFFVKVFRPVPHEGPTKGNRDGDGRPLVWRRATLLLSVRVEDIDGAVGRALCAQVHEHVVCRSVPVDVSAGPPCAGPLGAALRVVPAATELLADPVHFVEGALVAAELGAPRGKRA